MSSTRYPSRGNGVPAADDEFQRRVPNANGGCADRRQPLKAMAANLRALAILSDCSLTNLLEKRQTRRQ